MRYDKVITLLAVAYPTASTDAIGQQVGVPTRRDVFANEFEVGTAEFYAAGGQGLKADCLYQLRAEEYKGEPLMAVGDVEHNIIRVKRRGEWTLLTCERVLGNG